jgi:energy-coupling factor transporter ATP-binding protein EcfA2
MFKKVLAKDFTAVPYLETSQLMLNHPEGITFSLDKPNVILGPMGSGKSAIMRALALHTLSYSVGESAFENMYVEKLTHFDDLWTDGGYKAYDEDVGSGWKFLAGLTGDFDVAPAVFYRPGAIPGDRSDLNEAFCFGYSDLAWAHRDATEEKSTGQGNLALLQKFMAALEEGFPSKDYKFVNWDWGKTRKTREQLRDRGNPMPWELQAEVLKARYLNVPKDVIPCAMADEPERSLDAKAQAQFWQKVAAADMSRIQVIVTSHSLYPILYPERFHIIETVPGWVKEVRDIMKLAIRMA